MSRPLDPDVKAALKEYVAVQEHKASRRIIPCRRYKFYVTDMLCKLCKRSPEVKQALFLTFQMGGAVKRDVRCIHESTPRDPIIVSCCGNKKKESFRAFLCVEHGVTNNEIDCWSCNDYARNGTVE